MVRVLSVASAVLLALAACTSPGPAPTATPAASVATSTALSSEWTEQTTETASYRVMVRVGPSVSLQVMQAGATMTVMDQGRPVNHHLEVHIFDRRSGAEVKSLTPQVTITGPGIATPRGLPDVRACLLANHRVIEPHFGDNLYLADGTYSVAIGVGTERAIAEISV